ncbi:hypothetical protein NLG97_g6530 [Lecanicillium saksenae]|uniref:Uncharacterized protein n=1 Tax=Lecanicillium saksenae TaxID=468837 RepID=A0ACC1QPD4_9HYPO|nr:hypothetical protein NLG97_g6530 [Lecanicillium saksenae]
MKFAVVLAFATSALAAAIEPREVKPVSNEFARQGCRDIILLWARGSEQEGNMGNIPGITFAELIEKKYGGDKVAVQGLDYTAKTADNFKPKGASDDSINKMKKLITDVVKKCPSSRIILGGFSQGAAVVHGATKELDGKVLHRINAVVTFGGTMNRKHDKKVPNIPKEKTILICNKGDKICEDGKLELSPAHSDYEKRAREGAEFIFKLFGQDKAY